jgi:glycosyltransferase involved in cell wall biosynthesis
LKVSIIIITYNHESFIAQAIESVLKQKTNFPFEIIIGEDCSSDKTKIIVEKYSNLHLNQIKLITSTNNVGIIANELRCLKKAQGDYICFLEGDDYWTDPYKLQKQVDFLENNPEYGLVHSNVNHFNESTGKLSTDFNKNTSIPSGDIYDYLLLPSHAIKTMTVCFRRDLFEKYYLNNPNILNKDWFLIDISIWLMIAKHSKIHYINEVAATYRLLPESMSRTKNPKKLYEFHEKIHAIRHWFIETYGANEDVKNIVSINKFKSRLFDALLMNDKQLFTNSKEKLKNLNYKLTLKEKLKILKYNLLK